MESKNFLMKKGLPGEKNLFNRGFRLEITHLPTDYSVAFSAFIDQMSDSRDVVETFTSLSIEISSF